jgi:hypothetical protein
MHQASSVATVVVVEFGSVGDSYYGSEPVE